MIHDNETPQYESPAIEQELSTEDIDREVHYAGVGTIDIPS